MKQLQAQLGYTFKDATLLQLALTHRSLATEGAHNQRLEFLGDAVLHLLVADMLYQLYPDAAEGDLSKRLVALVNGEHLAEIARKLDLGPLLNMNDSEEQQGGRETVSNLEDACEAIIGAIYLDGGLEAGRAFINKFWKPYAETLKAAPKDAKTALQEWAQGRGLKLPEYIVLSSEGPAHAPNFVIEVHVEGQKPAKGQGSTKRVAERKAAENLLARIA